jgi:hypothetical protein
LIEPELPGLLNNEIVVLETIQRTGKNGAHRWDGHGTQGEYIPLYPEDERAIKRAGHGTATWHTPEPAIQPVTVLLKDTNGSRRITEVQTVTGDWLPVKSRNKEWAATMDKLKSEPQPGTIITTEAIAAAVTFNRYSERQVIIETPVQKRVIGHDHRYQRWFIAQGWVHRNELSNRGQQVKFPVGNRPSIRLQFEIDGRWTLVSIEPRQKEQTA